MLTRCYELYIMMKKLGTCIHEGLGKGYSIVSSWYFSLLFSYVN